MNTELASKYSRIIRSLQSSYDSIAPIYEGAFDQSGGSYSDVGSQELHSMSTLTSPREDEHVLDVGCGTGRLTIQLAAKARSVVGIDISREMLNVFRMKRWNDHITLVMGDALYLPFETKSFDVLTCMGTFDYYPPELTAAILTEFRRVIRTAGRVVFSVQNQNTSGIDKYIADSEAELGVTVYTYRESDLEGICADAGLQINKRRSAGLQLHLIAKRVEIMNAE